MTYSNRSLTLVTLLFCSTFAFGVQLSPSHQGGAIFLPLYSTENGNSSAFTISNHGVEPAAVKVLFLDQSGTTVSGFNLYLSEMDTWVAHISKKQGQIKMSVPDSSCTAPYLFESDDPAAELNLPPVGQILITDMGQVGGGIQVTFQIDPDTLLPRDCQLVNDSWAPGGEWNTDPQEDLSPPQEDIKAELQIINVQEGTVFTVPSLAFTDFSDIQMHTSPSELIPDLSWVNSADSQFENGAKSFVASSEGVMIEEDWSDPIDAVSVLLATRNLISTYTAETVIGATAEWILSFPTLKFYEDTGDSKDFSNAKISYISTDRNAINSPECPIVAIPLPCPVTGEFILEEFLTAIGSGVDSQFGVEEFIGQDDHIDPLAESGRLTMTLNHNYELIFIGQSGTEYFGLPVYAFGVQKYINGYLPGQDGQTILANYRTHIEITLGKHQNLGE